jgi:sec-independent protein translocase protein TatC
VFQLPLILFLLGWFGVISSDDLRSKRRVAIVLIFTVAMFLTPPDLFSQILMGIPLCLLYELAILGIWLKEKADRR